MGRAKKVLVADDYSLARNLLCKILNDHGLDTQQAQNGYQAFSMALEDPPDLMLLDVNMPEMDGYRTLEYVKHHPLTFKIPVLILSGLDWSYDRKMALDLGAYDYLPKPVRADDLCMKVDSALHKKRKKTVSSQVQYYRM
jgi:DNA-binding response OmpR family regulator